MNPENDSPVRGKLVAEEMTPEQTLALAELIMELVAEQERRNDAHAQEAKEAEGDHDADAA
jgi:hypothetical protein